MPTMAKEKNYSGILDNRQNLWIYVDEDPMRSL